MKPKYLFLDIDGVLNYDDWFKSTGHINNENILDVWISMIDPKCVERVNKILEETGAKLIVSSSWRDMSYLKEIFSRVGLPTEFDVTPHAYNLYSNEEHDEDSTLFWRGSEIKYWLEQHEDGTYVILDDDSDMLDEQLDNFIQTCDDKNYDYDLYIINEGSGLTDVVMNKAINILNGNCIK